MNYTAQKCESPVAAGLIAEQSSTDTHIVADTGAENKVISTLKARAALAGHVVHALKDGSYLAISTKWAGMARHCADAGQLAAFIAVSEGKL